MKLASFLITAFLLAMGGALLGQQSKAPAKKAPARAPVRKAPAKAAPQTSTSASRRYAQSRKKYTPPARASVGQARPTQERYREIQQALASRGYFNGEPSGEWGAESVQALKRFQEDQKLDSTGKLDALSLIALGLGPKRLAQESNSPPPAQ